MEAKDPNPSGGVTQKALPGKGARSWYSWLAGISLLGSVDVGQFLGTNTSMFASAPGRAVGSVLGLLLWVALAGLAGTAAVGHRPRRLPGAILGLAVLVAVGSLALTAIHASAHVGGLRPASVGVLSLAALSLAVLAVRGGAQVRPNLPPG